MSRWEIHERIDDQFSTDENGNKLPDSYCICPSSLSNGYPAVVLELARTPENRVAAEEIISLLNREFVEGQKARQASVAHALELLTDPEIDE